MVARRAAASRETTDVPAGEDYRLTPSMASRRLQVVSFVLQYLRRWGKSPSYGEIAGAMDIDRSTARDHIRRAIAKCELRRAPGRDRALLPPVDTIDVPLRIDPERAADLLARLRAEGYIMGAVSHYGTPTNRPLLGRCELDHIPAHGEDEWHSDDEAAAD